MKGKKIVGASSFETTPPAQKLTAKAGSGRPSMIFSPSDEFRNFWGENISGIWFEKGRRISLLTVMLVCLTLLVLYLCVSLLFSWDDLKMFYSGKDRQFVDYASLKSSVQPVQQDETPDQSVSQ